MAKRQTSQQHKRKFVWRYPEIYKIVDKWSEDDIIEKVVDFVKKCLRDRRYISYLTFFKDNGMYVNSQTYKDIAELKEKHPAAKKLIWIQELLKEEEIYLLCELTLKKAFDSKMSFFILANRHGWQYKGNSEATQEQIAINVQNYLDSKEKEKQEKKEPKQIVSKAVDAVITIQDTLNSLKGE